MKMPSRSYLFLVFMLMFSYSIANNREVIKIKSNTTGILKIEASSLNSFSNTFVNKNPKFFHLYKNGKEINFYIRNLNDAWNSQNAIYFYAKKNDGFLDNELYAKAGAALNPFYSMFSDTAVYILYVDESAEGLYYKEKTNTPAHTQIDEVEAENVLVFAEQYFFGKNYGSGATQSEYTLGEGYSGATWSIGGTQIRNFNLPTLSNASNVSIECYISGQSDAISANPNFNHHTSITLIGNGNTLLLDTMYKGYTCVRKKFNLSSNALSSSNSLQFTSINDLGAQSDFNTTPYIKLNYTQKTNLAGAKIFRCWLNSANKNNLYFNGVQQDSVLLFNQNTQTYYSPSLANDSIYYTVDGSTAKELYILASIKNEDLIQSFVFEKANVQEFDFTNEENELILLSSKKFENAANQFKQYKELKGIKTYLVMVEDLYNAYTYGYHHPLAVKRFVDAYVANAKVPAKNLFIIGKGIQSNLYANPSFAKRNYVPSIGIPPSDILYVSSLDFSKLEPSMGIGRIAVETNQEALDYLDKLKDQEANVDYSLWRKNIIHATGGRSIGENTSFSAALKACEDVAAQPYLGAKIINFNKKVNEPVSDNYREKIVELTDQGISLLSYYGHGANYFVEINFGEPEELNNRGRYPVYFLSGCSVGNFANDNSMGENYIHAKNRGAIGWLASSDLGFTSYLTEYHRTFYLNAFNTNYGKSIGEIQKASIADFANANDSINILHTRQMVYQGDPSYVLYAPNKADYALANNGFYVSNKKFANNDSVEIAFILTNTGKAIADSVEYTIERTVNNNKITYPILKQEALLNTDTVFYTLHKSKVLSGTNKIKLSIDPNQKIEELNELNNSTEKEFYLSSFNPIVVQPRNSSILKTNKLALVVQCSDLQAKNIEYNVEVDTIASFTSGYKKSFKWLEQQVLNKNIELSNLNVNSSVFVRVQIKNNSETSDWFVQELIYLPNNESKWIQNRVSSLNEELLNNVEIENNRLAFINNSVEFAINTRGDDARTDSVERRMRLNNNAPVFVASGITGICLLALEPKSLKRFSYASSYNLAANTPDYPFDKYRYSGVFVFNTNSATDRDSLLHYLNAIPPGYVVGGYNGLNANLSTLPENILQALESLGLAKVRSIPNGEPYAFVGYKSSSIGTAAEKTADPGIGTDPKNQFIRLNFTHIGKWDRGNVRSELIGPANKWKSIAWKFEKEPSDEFEIELNAIDTNGQIQFISKHVNAVDSLGISQIDANTFPYIQLNVAFKDSVNFSPATFTYWSANYGLPIELSVFPQYKYVLQPSTTLQGDTITHSVAYINLGEENVEKSELKLKLEMSDRTQRVLQTDTLLLVKSLDTILRTYRIPTRDLLGDVKVISSINSLESPENTSFNNSIEGAIKINKDLRQPKLSVSIDGTIPMQNDLISPRPLIHIKLKDENPFLLLNDSSFLKIEIKKPNASTYQAVQFQSEEVSYTPANSANNNELSVLYKPHFTEDGTYSMRIKVKDASNNNYNNEAYNIDFEVVNASSITHFFPYPNPFSTHTQFVFTLTGEVVPDDLKIQIMTVSGKIVREISKAELGPIKIGHNITEYKWNGTDEFGDRLANGVYLYRVVLKNANDFEKRSTSGDQYFKEGFGKLYLMK